MRGSRSRATALSGQPPASASGLHRFLYTICHLVSQAGRWFLPQTPITAGLPVVNRGLADAFPLVSIGHASSSLTAHTDCRCHFNFPKVGIRDIDIIENFNYNEPRLRFIECD